ncbi:hypothetical protein VCHA48O428_40330 [Vibrio chagasii]|nr:hypothetical protein VCHA48O428_40330 [Vibrio chagasii]
MQAVICNVDNTAIDTAKVQFKERNDLADIAILYIHKSPIQILQLHPRLADTCHQRYFQKYRQKISTTVQCHLVPSIAKF